MVALCTCVCVCVCSAQRKSRERAEKKKTHQKERLFASCQCIKTNKRLTPLHAHTKPKIPCERERATQSHLIFKLSSSLFLSLHRSPRQSQVLSAAVCWVTWTPYTLSKTEKFFSTVLDISPKRVCVTAVVRVILA